MEGKKRTGRYGGKPRFGTQSERDKEILEYTLELRKLKPFYSYRRLAEEVSKEFKGEFSQHRVRNWIRRAESDKRQTGKLKA